jgi:hypothetical protein
MAKPLSPEIHQRIFDELKSSFSDFVFFDRLVADKLKQAISDSNVIELNMKTTKKVAERYFDVESFKTKELKLVFAQIQLIFKACYVLILSYHEYPRSLFWNSVDDLLAKYPQFSICSDEERQLLLNFRNMVKVALMLIPARLNKQCILKVAGRLEGSQNEYITGGGQKPAVTRRVEIYEGEGGISAEKRPERVRGGAKSNSGSDCGDDEENRAEVHVSSSGKRHSTGLSDKKVKMIRLASGEYAQLGRGPNVVLPDMQSYAPSSFSATNHPSSFLSTLSDVAGQLHNQETLSNNLTGAGATVPLSRQSSDVLDQLSSDLWGAVPLPDATAAAAVSAWGGKMPAGVKRDNSFGLSDYIYNVFGSDANATGTAPLGGAIMPPPTGFIRTELGGMAASGVKSIPLERGHSLGFSSGMMFNMPGDNEK